MFCKNCGTELKEGVKFCAKCGTAVPVAAVAVQPVAAQIQHEPPCCAQCGTILKEGAAFCGSCGTQTGLPPMGKNAVTPVETAVSQDQNAEIPCASFSWGFFSVALALIAGLLVFLCRWTFILAKKILSFFEIPLFLGMDYVVSLFLILIIYGIQFNAAFSIWKKYKPKLKMLVIFIKATCNILYSAGLFFLCWTFFDNGILDEVFPFIWFILACAPLFLWIRDAWSEFSKKARIIGIAIDVFCVAVFIIISVHLDQFSIGYLALSVLMFDFWLIVIFGMIFAPVFFYTIIGIKKNLADAKIK